MASICRDSIEIVDVSRVYLWLKSLRIRYRFLNSKGPKILTIRFYAEGAHLRWGRYERATPNQRVALSTAGKVPYTFRAEKSYQDSGLSV